MKMNGAKQVHYDSGPNMTPLVDVVMVILIFLMLAGHFGGSTQFIVSKQGISAKGVGGAKADPNKPIETPIDIHISPARAGPGFVAEGPGIQATNSPTNLEASLEKKRDIFTSNGTPIDQLKITLYPTKNVKYSDLIQIYQAALQAKFTKVAFASTH